MKHQRLSLRPTSLWILFGPILGCMWLAAINYSNNLVYAILYLVASLTFVSFFYTRRNCTGIQIDHLRVHSGFSGEKIHAEIHLQNTLGRPVYGLVFSAVEKKTAGKIRLPLNLRGRAALAFTSEERGVAWVEFPAGRRARREIISVQIRSSYPFGLVYATLDFSVQQEFFVYPKPDGQAPLPVPYLAGADGFLAPSASGDDFAGVRGYLPGENLRHVDWKAYARGRPLMIKHYSGGDRPELELDESGLSQLPKEERLSQLAAWVLEAEREGMPFAMRLTGASLPVGSGPDHRRLALELLAGAESSSR